MNEKKALQLLHKLWMEIQQPDVIWQLLVLVACMGIAWGLARWWQRRGFAQLEQVHSAGTRLAFPLSAALLVAVAQAALEGVLAHLQLLAFALPLFATLALVRACVFVLRRSFPRAAWLAASERWVAVFVWICLALYITDLAPFVISALERIVLPVGKHPISLWVVLKGTLTVIATLVLALWIAGLIEARLMRAEVLDSSLRIVSVRVVRALLSLVALMSALSLVGIDMTALSVFTGALGVGLGFGLQKIASSYVAGFIILLDRSIRMGNVIQVGNDSGKVTEITTRYTVLRNLNGIEYIVPNETLVGATVQNQSYSNTEVCVVVSVGVAYDTDLENAMAVMEKAAAGHPRILRDPAPRAALARFGESAVELDLAFWVNDPELGLKNVRSDVLLAVWKAFGAAGISIPFPQREVRLVGTRDVEVVQG